ncbi:neuronal acetylcholine receptor subunit beta-2-like [Haliotis asinina]|uniref:neuronal acetylcholine receptor subunit beta-2-like n=1 Tax=Haliotis asinina TaxID=109174 RepID=UPI003531AD9A
MLTVAGSLTITWHDPHLTWNSSERSGQSFLELEEKDVWRPRIGLANSAENMGPLTSDNPVILFDSGIHRWELRDIFRVRCKITISAYPFDTQLCRLMFAPTFGYQLNVSIERIVKSDNYEENGEWHVGNLTHEKRNGDDDIEETDIIIRMDRKSTYYWMNVIIPISLMSLLNPFVFLIPARSGEKLGFLMAVYVSHTMFLNLINESVPPTSDNVSALTSFLTVIEVQGFFTVLASILVIAVHHRKEQAKEAKTRQLSISKNTEESLETKRPRRCCQNFSLERFLDGFFFVMSLMLSCSAFLLLQTGSTETPYQNMLS